MGDTATAAQHCQSEDLHQGFDHTLILSDRLFRKA